MAFLLPLLLLMLVVTASVVIAAYGTVFATYWFEMRHHHTDPPDLSATR
ncbi:hypothetical protein [Nocardia bhagyanarayanae]|uniref:Uncharacterized protein n=1 Tax=Nocardia bhagyanarayanae TaxID=1215925 RepID=A0A543FIT5_9NOCA|nr:hypothetical protein [Nocardia bhagyanarayanae]TQM33676.1 hypothetical protein FB390_5413 [Nocardia bhagyanarayanae]